MKYIKEVDSGELIPVPEEDDEIADLKIPQHLDADNFPSMNISVDDYSANEIIADLNKQLNDERRSKTVYHKIPFAKIIGAVCLSVGIILAGVFGIRLINSVEITPVVIEMEQTSANEQSEEVTGYSEKENSQDDNNSENVNEEKYFNKDKLAKFLFTIVSVSLIIVGGKKGISLVMHM